MLKTFPIALFAALLLVVPISRSGAAEAPDFDILIKNGRVLDGTGNPEFRADIGVRGDTIVAIGRNLRGATAHRVIDATGLFVTPAFIDMHSHADRYMVLPNTEVRKAKAAILQGVATVVGGPDGRTPRFPLQAEISAYESRGIGLNVVAMAGHGNIRSEVMGDDYERHATPDELEAMKKLLREQLEAGAWGLGTGLEYRPGRFSHPDEVIELCRVVAEYGGFHFSHMRSAGRLPKWQLPSMVEEWPLDGQDALVEIIRIAEETGIPSIASHVKAKGRMAWGRALNDIILVDLARERGVPVYLDQYPYEGHSGAPAVVIPYWALVAEDVDTSGGLDSPVYRQSGVFDNFREHLRRNLDDPETREKLRIDTEYAIDYNGGPDRIIITEFPDQSLRGKTLQDAADRWGVTPEEAVWELSLRGFEDRPQGAMLRPLSSHRKDVDLYMQQEYTMTSSDARLVAGPGTHPRHYGAFARKIGHYVRDREVISLAFAIRSSSGLPAQVIGLPDRGLLREGYKADILVFDFDTFGDRSTPLEPELYAEGIEYMLVNGEMTIDGGEFQGLLAGRVLLRHELQTTPQRVRTQRGTTED
ncbi:MAG: hypothetical protein EA423_07825 [Phycisphaerales bacterium]|nr:MAG: hypothetical protein EA423_07825 [Phycisphaerales bacterium]